jgi:methylaspartate ammonia-lyase
MEGNMKILEVICSKGKTGFYFDDQKAIKHNNAISDGAIYRGNPVTEGFTSVRQPGESISVMLILEDGQIAWGDCNAVQYSGAAGRDPLFLADVYMPVIEKYIKPLLEGQEITTFRQMAKEVDEFINPETGKRIHTAIRYGVTQAILDAVAKSRKMLMAEVLADEYNTKVSDNLTICRIKAAKTRSLLLYLLRSLEVSIKVIISGEASKKYAKPKLKGPPPKSETKTPR